MVISQTVYETKDGRTTKVESDQKLESSDKNDGKKNKKSELKSEEE